MSNEEKRKIEEEGALEAPEPIKEEPIGNARFDPTPLLARIDTLEKGQKLLDDTIKFVKETNFVLLVVLALGFIALIVSLISGVIIATNTDVKTQIEYIKSVETLRNEVENVNNKFFQATSSGTIIINK